MSHADTSQLQYAYNGVILPDSELNLSWASNHSWLEWTQHCTHNEAVVASILTVEEAVAGLEKEQACLGMVVIGGDSKCSKAFTLPQQLLLSWIGPLVWCSLREQTQIKWSTLFIYTYICWHRSPLVCGIPDNHNELTQPTNSFTHSHCTWIKFIIWLLKLSCFITYYKLRPSHIYWDYFLKLN